MRRFQGFFSLIGPASALALCALPMTPAMAKDEAGVQTSVGGTITNHLPRPRDDQRLQAEYPEVGTVRLTTVQYCGDADVALLSAANSDLDFVTNKDVSFVLGYWVTPKGASNPIPMENNWYPLASGTLASNNGRTETLGEIGRQGTAKNILAMVNESFNSLNAAAGYRMTGSSPQSYDLYYGVMMCKAIAKPSNASQAFPKPHNVSASLQTAGLGAIDSALASAPAIASLEKFSLGADADGVNITVGSGGSSIANDPFYELAKSVSALTFPATATDVTAYQQALAGDVWNRLAALHSQFYSKATCTSTDIAGIATAGKFEWEPYPLQLTCLALGNWSGKTLDDIIKAFLMPAAVPTEAQFLANQLDVAKLLTRAALMQQSQIALNASYKRPKDSCVTDGTVYINKLLGSQPINVASPKNSNSVTMVHPEGTFAMGTISRYRGGQGNATAIMKMSTEPFIPATLNQGQASAPPSLMTRSYLLRFNVRGIGCAGVWYCQNEDVGGIVSR